MQHFLGPPSVRGFVDFASRPHPKPSSLERALSPARIDFNCPRSGGESTAAYVITLTSLEAVTYSITICSHRISNDCVERITYLHIASSGHRPIEAELDDDLASPAVA